MTIKYTHRAVGPHTYTAETYHDQPVGVFRHDGPEDTEGTQVGEFRRNYSDIGPFFAFTQGGKDYALYSPNYTVTRVMSLPDCKDIAGETDETGAGYCPMEFYVPKTPEKDWVKPYIDHVDGRFGFVSGCYWGAEWYSPIYFLDLSGIAEERFTRDNRLGGPQQPRELELSQAVSVWMYEGDKHPIIDVAQGLECDLRKSYDWDPEVGAKTLLETVDRMRAEAMGDGKDPTTAVTKYVEGAILKYLRVRP